MTPDSPFLPRWAYEAGGRVRSAACATTVSQQEFPSSPKRFERRVRALRALESFGDEQKYTRKAQLLPTNTREKHF